MTMTIELVTDDQLLEGRFLSDHVPAVGDRIMFCGGRYRVTGRTWDIDKGWVELQVTRL
ncbi:MAG: hypothetical protein ABW046_22440 [Actinoplanes sp.]